MVLKLNQVSSEQLLKICAKDLISKGNSQIRTRQEEAIKFLDRVFRVRLGRGFYGDCLVSFFFLSFKLDAPIICMMIVVRVILRV